VFDLMVRVEKHDPLGCRRLRIDAPLRVQVLTSGGRINAFEFGINLLEAPKHLVE